MPLRDFQKVCVMLSKVTATLRAVYLDGEKS